MIFILHFLADMPVFYRTNMNQWEGSPATNLQNLFVASTNQGLFAQGVENTEKIRERCKNYERETGNSLNANTNEKVFFGYASLIRTWLKYEMISALTCSSHYI